ncbi:hypothetical protein [Salinimicrobium sp. GXAS 041]|uniref:hypothetical protein n=1 Tax=Salinimicrobium sp. GXAS 041 TaxID=3400806 RepID=UPI003C75791C
MKKSIYLLMMLVGAAFTSCEPMEDIHEEADASIDAMPVQGVEEYEFTDEDYEALELNFGNFSSLEDARAMIPGFLTNNFPIWGEGSLAQVTFDLYDPLRVEDAEVTAAGYEAVGLSEDYFSSMGEIQDFLGYEFPLAEEGDYVELTYRIVADEIMYAFDNDDFDLVKEELEEKYADQASSAAQYNNFERRETNDAYWSNEMILEAINVVLSENYDGVEGQTYNVSYPIYDGDSGSESMTVQYDGNVYIAVDSAESYTFTDADYEMAGTEYADVYPAPAANVAQYGSFAIQEGDNYWSEAMLLEVINDVLMEQYPSAEVGAEFIVEFDIYDAGVSTTSRAVALTEDGYVYNEESNTSVIQETRVFAYTNSMWNVPFTLDSEAYTEMGQSYSNFGDEEEAMYKIGIYLGREFPYAQEGDFMAVAFDLYTSGEGTSTEYVNYVLEDGEWNAIPSVIEQTLQFGHDGNAWVVDNTITHTLAPGDYAFIGEYFSEIYPDPSWSVGNYNNFDRRPGNRNQWTDEMILEAMSALLDNRLAPNAEEGQKYVLTFDIYNGTNTTEQVSLIKEGDAWVRV